jgi:ribonucleotide reductase alpha subunit
MAINFILIKQKIIIEIIKKLQIIIRSNRNYGFWLVSLLAFSLSPFITNDGLCLLLVTPVLDAFIPLISKNENENENEKKNENKKVQNQELDIIMKKYYDDKFENNESTHENDEINEVKFMEIKNEILEENENKSKNTNNENENCAIDTSVDRFYFMLTIACSSNIGMQRCT